MSMHLDQVKVLEQCRISPPPNSVPTTSIPLTFFDIDFLYVHPAQSLFIYRSPFSTAEFTKEILPQLKNSLSLALQRFFSYCGNCVCPPPPAKPHILYNDGDSVPFLVVQSAGNFDDFLQYRPTDAKPFRSLVPPTLPKRVSDGELEELLGLLSIKVTLFPNSGLCIGTTYHHVASDGMSQTHFMKMWASICKAKCDMSDVSIPLPIYDKGFLKDRDRITNFRLNQWRAMGSPICNDTIAPKEDCVRATFTMSGFEIDQLKKWISTKVYNGMDTAPKFYLSSFIAISAFIWVSSIKTLDRITTDSQKDGELCHFAVVADCRNIYSMCIPSTFFGNCTVAKLVSIARSKFKQEDCVAFVAEALSHCVQSLKAEKIGMDLKEFPKWEEVLEKGENVVTITSGPKIAVYETDFGWGRPEKVEAVHIDTTGSIFLSESRNEAGGVEVVLCRSRHEMEVFTSIFEAGMNQFRYRAML